MKKSILALATAAVLALSCTAFAAEDFDASKGEGAETKVALITMDQMDVHWVRLEAAAETLHQFLRVGGVTAGTAAAEDLLLGELMSWALAMWRASLPLAALKALMSAS